MKLRDTVAIFLILLFVRCVSSKIFNLPAVRRNISLIQPGRNVSSLLSAIMTDYDKNVRPFYGVRSVDVKVDILILSFGEIKEANMEFSMDLYLGLFWQDPRFDLALNQSLTLGGDYTDKFWLPDTFFVNSVQTSVHETILPNKKVWINLYGGHMMLSARMKSTASCKMNLRKYPMDDQICHLALESFSYDKDDLQYTWTKDVGQEIYIYDKEMAQFTVINATRQLKHPLYHSDKFSGLTVTIHFQRRTMYYIFQMYLPCVCIVALSWVSFWIDPEAIPARVGLSITTVLTICYMLGSVNSNLPRVSYVKAIDYFLLMSFGFIFLTLVEYVFVLRYSRKMKYIGRFVPGERTHPELVERANWKDELHKMEIRISMGGKSYLFTDTLDSAFSGSKECKNGTFYKHNGVKKYIRTCNHSKPVYRKKQNSEKRSLLKKLKTSLCRTVEGNQIDRCARLLFPFSYSLFLAIYFVALVFGSRMQSEDFTVGSF
ncbi:gamma-aminobutyric acid receptor subunit beta-like [Montipora foliosa]|uniref:gamma-aminobutyric acid receptor subunit beta-like n=1 Tax=Montipora foliosa TaxID=591990 RepID=UPI0035F1704F